MISLHCNRSRFDPQCMSLVGSKANLMAKGYTGKTGLTVPHDLVARLRIMLAVTISTQMGYKSNGITQPVRQCHVAFLRIVA